MSDKKIKTLEERLRLAQEDLELQKIASAYEKERIKNSTDYNSELEKARAIRSEDVRIYQKEADLATSLRDLRQEEYIKAKANLELLEATGAVSQDILDTEKKKLAIIQKLYEESEGVATAAEKIADKVNKAADAATKLEDKTKDIVTTLLGIDDKWKNTFVGAFTEAARGAGGLKGALKSVTMSLKEAFGGANILGSTLMKIVESLVRFTKEAYDASASFYEATGASMDFKDQIIDTQNEVKYLGVSLQEQSKAFASLYSEFKDFTELAPKTQDQLASTAAILGEIGVDANTTGKVFNELTKTFGKTATAAEQDLMDIVAVGQDIGVSASKMVSDFEAATPRLARFGSNAEYVFRGLAAQSKSLGVEMSELIAIAEGFDTFEGAADKAGTLNALLGGPYMNSLEMMMATDEERIQIIRDGVAASGRAVGMMGKYERGAIAQAMGVSDVSTAMKILQGDQTALDSMSAKSDGATGSMEKLAQAANEAKTITEDMSIIMQQFISGMGGVKEFTKALKGTFEAIQSLGNSLPWLVGGIGAVVLGFSIFLKLRMANALTALAGKTTLAAGATETMTVATATQTTAAGTATVTTTTYTGAVQRAGVAAGWSAGKIAAMALPIVAIGGAVWLAFQGFASLAESMKGMGAESIALVVIIIAFSVALYFMITALIGITAAGIPAAPVLAAIALGILAIGAAFALAALGIAAIVYAISFVIDSFSNLIEVASKNSDVLPALTLSILGMAAAALLLAWAGPAAFVGLAAMALGLGAIALALALIKTDDLKALGQLFEGLGNIATGNLANVVNPMKELLSLLDTMTDSAVARFRTISQIIKEMSGVVENWPLGALPEVNQTLTTVVDQAAKIESQPGGTAALEKLVESFSKAPRMTGPAITAAATTALQPTAAPKEQQGPTKLIIEKLELELKLDGRPISKKVWNDIQPDITKLINSAR